jgi:hypothetical protein
LTHKWVEISGFPIDVGLACSPSAATPTSTASPTRSWRTTSTTARGPSARPPARLHDLRARRLSGYALMACHRREVAHRDV